MMMIHSHVCLHAIVPVYIVYEFVSLAWNTEALELHTVLFNCSFDSLNVLQHVLEHGKPHERSAIISKLTGKIVQMSQQKFASNVIEKCLAFGDVTERRTMVNEMLGSTDENEPLQVHLLLYLLVSMYMFSTVAFIFNDKCLRTFMPSLSVVIVLFYACGIEFCFLRVL